MRIAFRVDASAQIATGHLMRCLALADLLGARGARVRFVSRSMQGHLQQMLLSRGHEFARIGAVPGSQPDDEPAHEKWPAALQASDASQTREALAGTDWDWVVVDHYALDERWEAAVRPCTRRIAAIDDIADRAHDCDLLLDQNLHDLARERYASLVPGHSRLLLGPRYALLRPEYRRLRESASPRDAAVRRLFVFFGGVDAENFTGQALEAIGRLSIADLAVEVVVGAANPFRAQIQEKCKSLGFGHHVQTDRMAELMVAADLAIGAGGSVTWERCCLGLPALALCTAPNQAEQLASAARAGLLCALAWAPEAGETCSIVVQRHLGALIENRIQRSAMSRAGMAAVDGLGTSRVADALGCTDIEIRPAAAGDEPQIWQWRNHPQVRAASRTPAAIDWNAHRSWFTAVRASSKQSLLIGAREGRPIGVVRFDISGEEAEVSIYLVPVPYARGCGSGLLAAAERWLTEHRPTVCRIIAVVLQGNERSERLFSEAGYRREPAHYVKSLYRE